MTRLLRFEMQRRPLRMPRAKGRKAFRNADSPVVCKQVARNCCVCAYMWLPGYCFQDGGPGDGYEWSVR